MSMIEQAATAAGIDAEAVSINNAPPAKQRGARYWQAFIHHLRRLISDQQAELVQACKRAATAQAEATELQRQLCELQRRQPSTYELLAIKARQGREQLDDYYREQCKRLHPDKGGNAAEFRQMQADYDSILALIGGERSTPYADLWEAVAG